MVRIDMSLQVSHVGCEDPCLYHVLSNTACKKVLGEWLDRRELVEGGVRVPAAYYYPSCIRTGCERQGSRLASVAPSLRATFVAFLSISSYFTNISSTDVFQRA